MEKWVDEVKIYYGRLYWCFTVSRYGKRYLSVLIPSPQIVFIALDSFKMSPGILKAICYNPNGRWSIIFMCVDEMSADVGVKPH